MFIETHNKTLVKTVLYRILSVLTLMGLALLYGTSYSIAGLLGFLILTIGSISYYIHNRVWVWVKWGVADTSERPTRSLIKSITYRLIVMIITFIQTKLLVTSNNGDALIFTLLQMVINFGLYYSIERIFDRINWGKKKTEEEVTE